MTTSNYYCPVDKRHGRLLSGRSSADRWFCPHSAHGGNGRFFTAAEAEGAYEMTDADTAVVYEAAAKDIVDERISLDTAVKMVAGQTSERTSIVRERLNTMAGVVKDKRTARAAARSAPKAKAAKPAPAARTKKEHIEPAAFDAIKQELGLSTKECIAALAGVLGAGDDGPTASRMTELTHSKGSTVDTFNLFEAALRKYAKSHPRPKASTKPAAAKASSGNGTARAKAKAPKPAAAKPATRRAAAAAKPARPASRRVAVMDDEDDEDDDD